MIKNGIYTLSQTLKVHIGGSSFESFSIVANFVESCMLSDKYSINMKNEYVYRPHVLFAVITMKVSSVFNKDYSNA